jgi:hypothetical protein
MRKKLFDNTKFLCYLHNYNLMFMKFQKFAPMFAVLGVFLFVLAPVVSTVQTFATSEPTHNVRVYANEQDMGYNMFTLCVDDIAYGYAVNIDGQDESNGLSKNYVPYARYNLPAGEHTIKVFHGVHTYEPSFCTNPEVEYKNLWQDTFTVEEGKLYEFKSVGKAVYSTQAPLYYKANLISRPHNGMHSAIIHLSNINSQMQTDVVFSDHGVCVDGAFVAETHSGSKQVAVAAGMHIIKPVIVSDNENACNDDRVRAHSIHVENGNHSFALHAVNPPCEHSLTGIQVDMWVSDVAKSEEKPVLHIVEQKPVVLAPEKTPSLDELQKVATGAGGETVRSGGFPILSAGLFVSLITVSAGFSLKSSRK